MSKTKGDAPDSPPNTPGQPLPGDQPEIDNSLPTDPPVVDNTLPPNVDNSLPPDQPQPGHPLPGDPPVVDNSLPPHVDHELPPIAPIDPDDQPDAGELVALMGEAKTVLVVLCDAEGKPIGGVKAEKVTADMFTHGPAGLSLSGTDISFQAPPEGAELAGYALIVDEKQVAWVDKDPPMTLVSNGNYSLAGDVVFPG